MPDTDPFGRLVPARPDPHARTGRRPVRARKLSAPSHNRDLSARHHLAQSTVRGGEWCSPVGRSLFVDFDEDGGVRSCSKGVCVCNDKEKKENNE